MGPDAMIWVFWMLSFKPSFSLSSFTFIKRLFRSSSLSAIRVLSSAYLRILIFLLEILITAWASSSPAFLMRYSAYKLNKQSENIQHSVQFSSFQSLSRVRLFVTPWTTAHQASLSNTNSQSLPKLMSIESVMPSKHLILCLPSPPSLNLAQHHGLFQWVSSSHQVAKVLEFQFQVSVLPMNIQDWFPLGWTGWTSLESRVFSNTTVQKHQFFSTQLSLSSNSHIHTWLLEKP